MSLNHSTFDFAGAEVSLKIQKKEMLYTVLQSKLHLYRKNIQVTSALILVTPRKFLHLKKEFVERFVIVAVGPNVCQILNPDLYLSLSGCHH